MRKAFRYILKTTLFLLLFIIVVLGFIKIKYGLGDSYPDIGSKNHEVKQLERIIKLDYPPGNIAAAQDSSLYFNYHPLTRPTRFSTATVFQWKNGKIKPFPTMEYQKKFQGSFGLTIDKQNHLWLIEPATFDFKHTRIWAFDLKTGKESHFYEFPEGVAQFAEEIRVTADGKYVLLPNPGVFRFTSSKLLVYSVENHSVRTAMDGDISVQPENWVMHTSKGEPYRLSWGLLNFAVGIDGIEISEDQKWVYIASMTHSHLYRVQLSDVLNKDIKPKDIASRIDDLGLKPMSDGITVDKKGNVIITDVEYGRLMSYDIKSKKIKTIGESKNVLWADGVASGADGALYLTDSAIPLYIGELGATPDIKKLLKNKPYYIYKLNKYN